jgi:hypothetical protein
MPHNAQAFVGSISRKWRTGSTLKVYFFPDGNESFYERAELVLRHASEWSPHTGVYFELTFDIDKSDIRVSFGKYSTPAEAMEYRAVWALALGPFALGMPVYGGFKGDRSGEEHAWSFVGTDAEAHKGDVTLNLGFRCFRGGLPQGRVDQDQFKGTVLHEFGHALGFEHENPGSVPYDKAKVYAHYRRHGWDDEKIERNLFERRGTALSPFDKDSIMSYAVPEELLDMTDPRARDFIHGANNKLSANDKHYAERFYGVR